MFPAFRLPDFPDLSGLVWLGIMTLGILHGAPRLTWTLQGVHRGCKLQMAVYKCTAWMRDSHLLTVIQAVLAAV